MFADHDATEPVGCENPVTPPRRTRESHHRDDRDGEHEVRPSGRGVIVGGTREFEGIRGSFVEVSHLTHMSRNRGGIGIVDLQLAYRKVPNVRGDSTVSALLARDRQLGLVTAEEDRQVAQLSLEPPLNFNSRRDIPFGSVSGDRKSQFLEGKPPGPATVAMLSCLFRL